MIGSKLDIVVLDDNRDDYYGHSGSWWDVQDSLWLSHLPQLPLTLAVSGHGTLTATVSGAALPCNNGCSNIALDNGANISVVPQPDPGFKLSAWSGACTGSGICGFTLGQASTVTATFAKATVRISVTISGLGRILSAPAGINCPGACNDAFESGAS